MKTTAKELAIRNKWIDVIGEEKYNELTFTSNLKCSKISNITGWCHDYGFEPENVELFEMNTFRDGEFLEHQITHYRPKSLQGIETNNGWNRIDEVGLPSENGDYWFYSETMPIQISEHYFHAKSKRCKEQTIRNHTHYQPIIKPEKAIY